MPYTGNGAASSRSAGQTAVMLAINANSADAANDKVIAEQGLTDLQNQAAALISSWADLNAQGNVEWAAWKAERAERRSREWNNVAEAGDIYPDSPLHILFTVRGRGLSRVQNISAPFLYNAPKLNASHTSNRAIIFGLYSGAYVHGYRYLTDISVDEIQDLINAYERAMFELSDQEQRWVVDMTAQRYLNDQQIALKDAAIYNQDLERLTKESDVDARTLAIEADIDALANKAAELELIREKTLLMIKEQEAKLVDQSRESQMIDIENNQHQLARMKSELELIESGIRALEIQAQIAEAAYRLATVNVRKADIEADIGRLMLNSAETVAKRVEIAADIQNKDYDIAEVGVRLAGIENDIGKTELEIANVDVKLAGIASDIGRIDLDISEVGVRTALLEAETDRLDIDIEEIAIKRLNLETERDRIDVDLAEVDVKKAMLEADIGKLGLDRQEVEVRIAQTEADTARLVVQKRMESLTEAELIVASAENTAYGQETDLITQRAPLLDQRIEAADEEINTTIPSLKDAIEGEKDADLVSQQARSEHQIAEYENRALNYASKTDVSNMLRDMEVEGDVYEGEIIGEHSQDTLEYYSARMWATRERHSGALEAAKIMREADIVNTLTHQIGKA